MSEHMETNVKQPSQEVAENNDTVTVDGTIGARPTGKSRGRKLAELHAQRLPIVTTPLPAFIPQNPLSYIRIAFALLSEYFSKPVSHPVYQGYFSPGTRSVHVTDPATVRALWEKGFFGKGSLSRSEPNWLAQEEKKLGLGQADTAEANTNKRRKERQAMKMERARIERENLEAQLRKEKGTVTVPITLSDSPKPSTSTIPAPASDRQTALSETTRDMYRANREFTNDNSPESRNIGRTSIIQSKQPNQQHEILLAAADVTTATSTAVDVARKPPTIVNQEHLQLSLEEAFFLVYGLGILRVEFSASIGPHDSDSEFLGICCRYFAFPPAPTFPAPAPDDSFLLRYVVYHHFRSLGWVVRDGIKFSIDFLLYERGPVFKHAEFAIIIIPSYSHLYWAETEERRQKVEKERQRRSWHWLHCINRVQTQVTKTLVLCYVDIPPPLTSMTDEVGQVLSRYRIREFPVRRWSANRHRQ